MNWSSAICRCGETRLANAPICLIIGSPCRITRHRARCPIVYRLEYLAQNGTEIVAHRPSGIMRLETADVADPPDMVAGPVGLGVGPAHRAAGQRLTFLDRLDHRAVAVAPAPD